MFTRLREWRHRRIVERHGIDVDLWSRVIAEHRLFDHFDSAQLRGLHDLAALFLHEKRVFGTHALEITDFMRVTVAAQAVVPILNLDLSYYRGWTVILLYPGAFIARHEFTDEAGVVHVIEEELDGEAMDAGSVVISWEQASAGPQRFPRTNVVIHELAHKLDYLNGDANGLPPLHGDMSVNAWARAFGEAYAHMNAQLERNAPLRLDSYAAESPAEFFAVMSEAFFETPGDLVDTYPEVYRELAAFYRQNPLRPAHNF
ncbi:MAG: zinc-dependent peptidase [Gammaproteobacteria bacterium]|nr:zinc-dependent peptidase [Gammaproteobacteria bacterium]